MKITLGRWAQAQNDEFAHHQDLTLGAYSRTHEVVAQYLDFDYKEDFRDKVIVEVGCAAQPHLLQCQSNFKKAYAIEPLIDRWPQSIKDNWTQNNIIAVNEAYELAEIPDADETWLFNVISHVIDPVEMMQKAMRTSKIVRFFEPIDQPINMAHPHEITMQLIEKVMGPFGEIYQGGSEPGFHGANCYYGTWRA